MQQLGSAPYPFGFFISFGWIVVFLLLGAVLRMKIPLFQRYLIPGCMLGGLLGCIVINTGVTSFLGQFAPDFRSLEGIVYHLYNLTFVALGFNGLGGTGKAAPAMLKNTLRCSFLSSTCSYMQTCIGILVIFLFNLFLGTELLESAGILVSKGFGGGPGQAMAQGAAYQQAGYPGMVSLGLSFAAIGYVFSIIIGVPVANLIMRKRGLEGRGVTATKAEGRGVYVPGTAPETGKMTFMGTNIDTLSFHICMLLLCYAFSYMVMIFVGSTGFFSPKSMSMIWTLFAPLFCLPMGMIAKSIILDKVCKAEHLFDRGTHNRVLNAMIDLTAVAALVGIQIKVLLDWLPVLTIISLIAAFATLGFYYLMTKNNKEFAEERLLGLLGLSTGTITSGLVLIRMIDPEYKSTVPYELGLMAIPSLLIILPLLPIVTPLSFGQVFYSEASWFAPFLTAQQAWIVPFLTAAAQFIIFGIAALILGKMIDKRKKASVVN